MLEEIWKDKTFLSEFLPRSIPGKNTGTVLEKNRKEKIVLSEFIPGSVPGRNIPKTPHTYNGQTQEKNYQLFFLSQRDQFQLNNSREANHRKGSWPSIISTIGT